ncbi:hypothetical protein ACTFIR_002439 [Dictyostelium discoideum]
MKIILTLSIFLICFLRLGQSIIDPSQKDVMSGLFFDLYEYSTSLDPCDNSAYVVCKNINSTSTFQTVVQLNLNSVAGQDYVITQDLSPLQNLTYLQFFGNGIYLASSFFNYVNKFSQLERIYLESFNSTIPDDTIFPASLDTFTIYNPSVSLGRAIFESTIKNIYIYSPLVGYSIPTLINVNPYLESLQLSATFYSGFPSNLSLVFSNLLSLEILVLNDMNENNYKNFSISNIGVFKNLKSLEFEFTDSNNPQEFYIHSFLSNVPLIDYIYIYGQGVTIDPSVGILDLSYIKPEENFEIEIEESSILSNCKDTCVKFPKNSLFYSYYNSFSYDAIDFSNLVVFYDYSNEYEQYLPNIDNAPSLDQIYISNSIVVGDIPESYCRINKLSLRNNELNGTVPSCIQCLGGAGKGGGMVLPNPLLNFDKTTKPSCPNFKVDQNYTNLLPTDGSGKIIVTGTNLGWEGNGLTPIIANSKLAITIPMGVGTNKNITVTFQNGEKRTFNYSYVPPFIKSYGLLELDGLNYFTINGTGFDFDYSNNITINGQQFSFYNALGGGDNDGLIALPLNEVPNFATESKFTVSAFVGGQSSNEVTFYYFNSINITEEKLVLNNTGGSVDLNGSFVTNNISLVSVSINDTNCLVTSYTNSKLTIQYPSNQIGDNYVLTLNVGGYAVNLVVEYVETPTPSPSTTPSATPTQSTTPSSTPTQSPGDDGSTSSTLSISFYLIALLLLVQQFI